MAMLGLNGGGNSPQQDVLAPAQQGYNAAMGSLQSAMQSAQGSNSAQLAAAGQQLKQNQSVTQQGLINKGLGNTTVAGTAMQAPLATYNNQVNALQNQLQGQMTGLYGQQAGVQAQGGDQMSQLLASLYAQQMNQPQTQGTAVRQNGVGPLGGG